MKANLMVKTFKYRIFPTRKQTTLLQFQLEECRWLYNHFLEERKATYEATGKSPNYHTQAISLPALKEARPSLTTVNAQALQNVAVRVDLAYQAYFRRCKAPVRAGEKPGYPRFKGYGRYDSLTFPQVKSSCEIKNNLLVVSKVGHIKIVLHRKLEGTPKTATLTRTSTGKWYVCFACEVEPKRLPANSEVVGIDVGLKTFATLSDGQEVENPRFFRTEEKALKKASRKLSKAPVQEVKGTPERKKKRKVVARVHERIGWRRTNFSHQHSRKVVNQFGTIFVEDLHVNRMMHNHFGGPCLAKSISDAAWSNFFSMLSNKAVEAGYKLIKVNPAYTSQTCSRCGHRASVKLTLDVRIFNCECCNLQLDRDLNAALNIKALGLQSVRLPVEAVEGLTE